MRTITKMILKSYIQDNGTWERVDTNWIDNPVIGFVPHVLECHIVKKFLLDTLCYVPLPLIVSDRANLQNWNDVNYLFSYHCPKTDILIEIYWSME